MAFTLPPLPYDYTALEPHIDEQTMRIHHDKHHGTYVTNLNAALEPHPDLQKKSIEELIAKVDALPEAIRTPVRNNGGGHVNHTMFWEMMAPGGAKEPTGPLADAITKALLLKGAAGNAVANPLLKIARCAAADMVHFAGEFGMTPLARSRLGAPVPPEPGKFGHLLT